MLVLSAGPASTDSLQPLAAGVDDEPPPEPRGPDAPPVISRYDPSVEQWRSQIWQGMPDSLKSRPDAATLLDKTLHAVQGESSGDPGATGDGGVAHGLFQSHYVGAGATPQAQIADAWRLVQGDIQQGGTGFGDWGEGRSYQGQPFGAFGRTPYGAGDPLAQHLSTGQTSNFIPGPSIAPQPFSPYVPQPDPFQTTGAEQQMQYNAPQQDVTPYQPYVGSDLQQHLSTGGPMVVNPDTDAGQQTLQEMQGQANDTLNPGGNYYTPEEAAQERQARAQAIAGRAGGGVLPIVGAAERASRIADIPYADRVRGAVQSGINYAIPGIEESIRYGLGNPIGPYGRQGQPTPAQAKAGAPIVAQAVNPVPTNVRDLALTLAPFARPVAEAGAELLGGSRVGQAAEEALTVARQGGRFGPRIAPYEGTTGTVVDEAGNVVRAPQAALGEPQPGPTDVGRPARPGMQFQPVGGGAPTPAEEAAQGAGRALPAGTSVGPEAANRGGLAALPAPRNELERNLDALVEEKRAGGRELQISPQEMSDVYKQSLGPKSKAEFPGETRLSFNDWRVGTQLGLSEGNWYATFSKWLSQLSGGRLPESLLNFAVGSQQAEPSKNMIKAFNAMAAVNDLTQGGKAPLVYQDLASRIGAGTPDGMSGDQVKKIVEAYTTGRAATTSPGAAKTPSYNRNLADAFAGRYSPFVTADTHHLAYSGVGQNRGAGGEYDIRGAARAPSPEAYAFVNRLTQHLAAEFGLQPDTVQAAMWDTIKKVKEAEKGQVAKDFNAGKITFEEAARRAQGYPSTGSFQESFKDPDVARAYQRYQDSIQRFPPPGRNLEFSYSPKPKGTPAGNLEVNEALGEQMRTDVTQRSPVVLPPRGTDLVALGLDPQTGRFPELEAARIPHDIEGNAVRLPGGNIDTADYVGALLSKRSGTESGWVVELPNSRVTGTPSLELDHPAGTPWTGAEIAKLREGPGAEHLVFTPRSDDPGVLQIYDVSRVVPDWKLTAERAVRDAGYKPQSLRAGKLDATFRSGAETDGTLTRLSPTFDARGNIASRTDAITGRGAGNAPGRLGARGNAPGAGQGAGAQGVPGPVVQQQQAQAGGGTGQPGGLTPSQAATRSLSGASSTTSTGAAGSGIGSTGAATPPTPDEETLARNFVANAPGGGTVPARQPYGPGRSEEFAKAINAPGYGAQTQSTLRPGIESVQEAIDTGRKLGYSDADIAAYIKRNYLGQGGRSPTGTTSAPTPATTVPAGTAAQPTTTNAPTSVTTTTQPPVGGAQPALPPIGDSGIKDALARKEEATLTPGQVFGPEGNLRRKVAGAINPSVDLPRSVHVANQARTAVQATLRTEFGRSEIPATRAIANRFDAEKPKYLGPAGRPNAGDWTDYALNPGYYQASPELTAAKDALKAVQDANLAKARSEYGVEVGRFEPRDPDGVYLPNLTSREAEEKAVQAVAGSLSSHGSVTAERAYNDINDRLEKHPDWQPERDPGILADTHSSALARIAGNNTFKAGVGGKTKLEVVDELHPGLVKARDKVRQDIANLRSRVQTALQQAKTSGAVSRLTAAQEKAATARSALIDARVQSLGQEYGPELSHLSGQLHELRRQVNQLGGLQSAVGARAVGATARAAGFRSQITSLQTQLEGLAQQVRSAGTGDYALNPTTYRYHEPAVSAAIDSVTRPATFHNAFIDNALKAGNTLRAIGLGPDFSPLTIQGLLGALSHPDVMVQNAANFVKIFNSDEALQKLLDPALVRRYEFASGRPLGSASEDLLKSTVGPQIGLGNRPVKRFNDALERVLDYGSLKAFEVDSKILQSGKNGLPQNVADHEAESALSKVVPRINNAAQGRSAQRVALEGALPTSRSFTVQPFALAKDFVSGAAKLTRGAAGKIPGVGPGPELSGREDLAIIRGLTLFASLLTISITSALLSAEANKKDPISAVKEVMDPSSGKFLNLILGNAGSIGLGGPMRSAFLGVFRTMTQGPQGGINYARNRLEPVLGATVDVLTNTDFRGNPVRTGSPWNQMLQSAVHIAQGANLLGGGITQGYGESGAQGAAEQAASGLGGVNYQERSQYEKRDLIARQGIQVKQPDGTTKLMKADSYQSASPALKDAINKMNVTDLSDYRKASDASHQTSKATTAREEDLFNKGQNDQAPRDFYHDEGQRNLGISAALENQFAAQFAGFDKSKFDKAVEGYYALDKASENLIPEGQTGAGGIDFDKVASAQKDYLASLPADQRQWVSEALQVAEANKTPLHQEYDKYIDAKKQAGYFETHIDPVTKRPTGITPQQRQALDIAHPDLDVASWRFGSVGGKAGSALNSPGAVQMALATPDAQNKEITYAGLPRPVNQSPDTIAMWNYAKGPLDWYLTQLPNGPDAVNEGKRLAADKNDKEYLKPLDQMDTQHRSTITGNLHRAALDSSLGDELEAYLYAFGERTSLTTQAAYDKSVEIIKKYHLDQVKAPMKKAA